MSKLIGNQEFNGDVYIKGVGGYDGTNAGQIGVLTLQQVLNGGGITNYVKVQSFAMYDDTPVIETGSGFNYSDLNNNPPIIMDSQNITIEETDLDGGLGSIDEIVLFEEDGRIRYHLSRGYYVSLYLSNGEPSYIQIMGD